MEERKVNLPSKKAIETSIGVVEEFRDLCQLQLETGYWATVDFISKHHLNKILSLQYRPKAELEEFYGKGLTERAIRTIQICKAYLMFVRG